MNTSEIVSIQLGRAANFTGSHWWNLQESSFRFDKSALEDETRLNHSVLFREGQNWKGQFTYTPRLVSVDFRDSVGNCEPTRRLYPTRDGQQESVAWGGNSEVKKSERDAKNPFLSDLEREEETGNSEAREKITRKYYDMESVVESWTDFLRVPLHPRSLQTLPPPHLTGGVCLWEEEQELLRGSAAEELEDAVRRFVEETDACQGFHMLFDMDDAFGAVAEWFLTYLMEEYAKRPILCFPITHRDKESKEEAGWAWSAARTIWSLRDSGAIWSPLSAFGDPFGRSRPRQFPWFPYKPWLLYQSCGILAACLETATSPWRSRLGTTRLADACASLAPFSRMPSLHLSFPWAMKDERPVSECLTMFCDRDSALSAQVFRIISTRGLLDADIPRQPTFNNNLEEVTRKCFERQSTSLDLYMGKDPLHTNTPFPQVFSEMLGWDGRPGARRAASLIVSSVPACAQLRASTDDIQSVVSSVLANLPDSAVKLKVDKDYFKRVVTDLRSLQESSSISLL